MGAPRGSFCMWAASGQWARRRQGGLRRGWTDSLRIGAFCQLLEPGEPQRAAVLASGWVLAVTPVGFPRGATDPNLFVLLGSRLVLVVLPGGHDVDGLFSVFPGDHDVSGPYELLTHGKLVHELRPWDLCGDAFGFEEACQDLRAMEAFGCVDNNKVGWSHGLSVGLRGRSFKQGSWFGWIGHEWPRRDPRPCARKPAAHGLVARRVPHTVGRSNHGDGPHKIRPHRLGHRNRSTKRGNR